LTSGREVPLHEIDRPNRTPAVHFSGNGVRQERHASSLFVRFVLSDVPSEFQPVRLGLTFHA
jgi:hypothetical protein